MWKYEICYDSLDTREEEIQVKKEIVDILKSHNISLSQAFYVFNEILGDISTKNKTTFDYE